MESPCEQEVAKCSNGKYAVLTKPHLGLYLSAMPSLDKLLVGAVENQPKEKVKKCMHKLMYVFTIVFLLGANLPKR